VLDAATALRADAVAGRGGLLWVEGDAGIGKTEVLDAVVDAAFDDGMRVARAAGAEDGAEIPFGTVAALLADGLRGRSAAERASVLRGAAAPAAGLLGSTDPGDGGPSMASATAWALTNLAADGPLLLVIDDAHWADPSSLRTLRLVAGWVSDLPAAIVVAARPVPDRATAPALAVLRAAAERPAEHLGPLGHQGIAAVIRASGYPDARPELVEAFAVASDGNPLLVRELLATLHADGIGDRRAAERLTATGATGLATSLARLPAAARDTAEALTVAGADATEALVVALTGHDAARVAADLAALRQAGLLAPAPSLAYTHAAIRAAVRARLAPGRLAALHAATARRLDAAGAPPARIAAHLLAAPPTGDARAVDVLVAASAEAARLGAPELGAPALRRALEEPLDPPRRAAVLLALAAAEAAEGTEEAGARYAEALDLLEDPVARARCLAAAAEWHTGRGRTRLAAALLERAEQEVRAGHPELARSLEGTRLAVSTLDLELRPRVQRHLAELVHTPPVHPTPGERGLLALLAWEQALAGVSHDQALSLARAALDDGRLLADETSDGISIYVAAGALLIADSLQEDVALLDAALADARARGSMNAFANASFCRGWPLLHLGRVDEAAADFELALGTMRLGWETYVPVARAGLASALLERAGPAEALAALQLDDTRASWGDTSMFTTTLVAAAQVTAAAGQHERALALAEEAGERLAALGWLGPGHSAWRPVAAISAAVLGDHARARALADEEIERARRFGAPRTLAWALLGAGRIQPRDESVATLREAVAVARTSEARLVEAHCVVALGGALHAAGDVEPARQTLREGLDLADRTGARTLAAGARASLVAAGARPRRARLTGPAALTPAERRVAKMAAEGLANREIAEALWVTVKAVEFNLSRAYAKLGVRGRDGLAGAFAVETQPGP